jgi:hypothetical protein
MRDPHAIYEGDPPISVPRSVLIDAVLAVSMYADIVRVEVRDDPWLRRTEAALDELLSQGDEPDWPTSPRAPA